MDPTDVRIEWTPVPGAEAYVVEIENDDIEVSITAEVPGDASGFTVPPDFLEPGTEYDVGVGSVNSVGNLAVAESSFVTSSP